MAICEKCWEDAGWDAGPEAYSRLIKERATNQCSPEQQCGEMHIVLPWTYGDRPDQCRCGKVTRCLTTEELRCYSQDNRADNARQRTILGLKQPPTRH